MPTLPSQHFIHAQDIRSHLPHPEEKNLTCIWFGLCGQGRKSIALTFAYLTAGTRSSWVELCPWWRHHDPFPGPHPCPFLVIWTIFPWPKSNLRKWHLPRPSIRESDGRDLRDQIMWLTFITRRTPTSSQAQWGEVVKAPQPASSCQKPVCCSNSLSSALFYKKRGGCKANPVHRCVSFGLHGIFRLLKCSQHFKKWEISPKLSNILDCLEKLKIWCAGFIYISIWPG